MSFASLRALSKFSARCCLVGTLLPIAGGCEKHDPKPLRVFRMERWAGGEVRGMLLKTCADGDILLLKGLNWRDAYDLDHGHCLGEGKFEPQVGAAGGIIYRYDSRSGRMDTASERDWQDAAGDFWGSLSCMVVTDADKDILVHPRSNLLLDHERVVKTTGKTALASQASPKGDLLVVLSADGERSPGVMSFIGQGGASGQHYQEIFQLPGMKRIGEPIKLPIDTKRSTMSPCWSADPRDVIYADVGFANVCIVLVSVQAGDNR
jgi:hypothetical protein